jgi:hypothetical protein
LHQEPEHQQPQSEACLCPLPNQAIRERLWEESLAAPAPGSLYYRDLWRDILADSLGRLGGEDNPSTTAHAISHASAATPRCSHEKSQSSDVITGARSLTATDVKGAE